MQCSNDTRRITIHNESTSKALRVLNGGSRAKLSILNSSCFFPEGYRNVRCFFFLFCLTWYLHSSATSPTVWKEKTTTQQKTLFASPLSILQELTAFKRIELLWFYPQRKRSKHTMQVIAAFQKKKHLNYSFVWISDELQRIATAARGIGWLPDTFKRGYALNHKRGGGRGDANMSV